MVLRLARDADVFLGSSLPGQLERRGLGPDDVLEVNPDVVYCALTGYGQEGPYRDRPGHDLDYLAVGGVLSVLGSAGIRPVPPGLQIADLAGGTLAALEIVSALFRRERTGEGAVLDVAVLDAIVAWLGPLGAGLETAGSAPGPLAGAYPCYGVYAASDGRWLALGALEPQFWVAFCRAIEREDLVPRQFDPSAIAELAGIFGSRTGADWLAELGDDACVVPVNTPAEVELDPHVRARGLIVGEGAGMHVVTPLRAAAGDGDGRGAPGLGEDTLDVLASAGFPADEVAALKATGIVAGPATPEATARAARLGTALARLAQRSRAKASESSDGPDTVPRSRAGAAGSATR